MPFLKMRVFQTSAIAFFAIFSSLPLARAEDIARITNIHSGAGEVIILVSLDDNVLTVRRDFLRPCNYDKHPKYIQRKIRLEDIGRVKIFPEIRDMSAAIEIRVKDEISGPLAYEVEAKNCFDQPLRTDMEDYEFIFGPMDDLLNILKALK